jgi:hypothetical protein
MKTWIAREKRNHKRGAEGAIVDKKYRGNHSELLACAWLLSEGYEVFRNVSHWGPADIVGMKSGRCFLFDVKTGANAAITREQHDLGVRLIFVASDGSCKIRKALTMITRLKGQG